MDSLKVALFLSGVLLIFTQSNNIAECFSEEYNYDSEEPLPAYDTSFNYSDTNVSEDSEETTTIPSFIMPDIQLKPTENSSSFEPVPYVEEISTQAKTVDEQTEELVRIYSERKQKEQLEVAEISLLLQRISGLNSKLNDVESYLDGLKNDATNLASGLPVSGSTSYPSAITSSRKHTAWATFYRYINQSGGSTIVDFRECSRSDTCCKNLELAFDNDTRSIHTHDTCVQVFRDRDCSGESRIYKPGTYDHSDFGSFRDSISSAKPCYE